MRPELERAQRTLIERMKRAMELSADDLLARSIHDAPVEEGALRGSGARSGVEQNGDNYSITVSFDTPYAHAQHEGYIDYGAERVVQIPAHWRTMQTSAGPRRVRVRAHTQTRRGRVYFRHHPLGGGKKYLERNVVAMGPRYRNAIAASLRA